MSRLALLANLLIAFTLTSKVMVAQNPCSSDSAWGVTGNPVPGEGYEAYDWRSVNSARLPQTVRYSLYATAFAGQADDWVDITIEDGARMGVAANEAVIILRSSAQVTWAKEIALWNLENGIVSSVGTKDADHGPKIMLVRRSGCSFETLVLRKAMTFGVMTDVYHLDPTNFWRLSAGKVLTLTWQVDVRTYSFPGQVDAYCGAVVTSDPACLPYDFAARTPAAKLVGDFDGDKKSDIALLGPPGWNTVPIAFSKGDGSFRVTNLGIQDFAGLASVPGAKIATGDFNGDSRTDLAITGPSGWNTVPVAFSNGDGTFRVTNFPAGLLSWGASNPGVRVLTGDFNSDGKTDFALTGVAGWNTIILGLSNGDGTFNVINAPVGAFGSLAATAGIRVLTGDLNGDGSTDIALVGGSGWKSIPVAFSTSGGFSSVTNDGFTNFPAGDFAVWASNPRAQAFIGDFDGNGRADIALSGPPEWDSVPIAYSWGNGTFHVVNQNTWFAKTAANWGAQLFVGDFNGDRHVDLLQTGGRGWASTPVGFGGFGSLSFTNASITDFNTWTSLPWGTALAGDFNGDGKTDLAVTGPSGFASLPVAFSNGDGTFIVTNRAIGDFATWASRECGTIHQF
jgi:hypothetical protein